MQSTREIFELWLKKRKSYLTRPDKYSSTIVTISNHLNKNGHNENIYHVINAEEVVKIKDLYFSYNQYYLQNIRGNHMYSRSLDLYIEFLDSSELLEENKISPEIERILLDKSIAETEKQSIILSRRGQGKFRENLIKIWGKCLISGHNDPRLLVASHIKPWNISDNKERIDPYNGLLLLPTYDKLFDLGLISFSEKGKILISDQLTNHHLLSISQDTRIAITTNHLKYLDFHNKTIFKNS